MGTMDSLKSSFLRFMANSKDEVLLIVCLENKNPVIGNLLRMRGTIKI